MSNSYNLNKISETLGCLNNQINVCSLYKLQEEILRNKQFPLNTPPGLGTFIIICSWPITGKTPPLVNGVSMAITQFERGSRTAL